MKTAYVHQTTEVIQVVKAIRPARKGKPSLSTFDLIDDSLKRKISHPTSRELRNVSLSIRQVVEESIDILQDCSQSEHQHF